MDQKLEDLKKIYENPPIPEELSTRIEALLNQSQPIHSKREQERIKMNNENVKKRRRIFSGTIAAAAALIIFTAAFAISVNTIPAFADTVKDLPVLGAIAKVFTAEEIKKDDDVVNIDMKLPAVDGIKDKAFEKQINDEIKEKMTFVVEETRKSAAEDKKAWLSTGGKEADYRKVDIIVDYRVESISDSVLSFLIFQTSTQASYYANQYYYNIDLKNNRDLTLKDLLGDNYIEIANQQISAQISERAKNPDNMFFDGTEGIPGFSTIAKDQNFYVNDRGNPVIVFNKYEIAPGYMGTQEFEIIK